MKEKIDLTEREFYNQIQLETKKMLTDKQKEEVRQRLMRQTLILKKLKEKQLQPLQGKTTSTSPTVRRAMRALNKVSLQHQTKQGKPDREAYYRELRARSASSLEEARSMMSTPDSSQESSQRQKPTP